MFGPETVLAGAPHPGTQPGVMGSSAGYYIGYRDDDGLPYSRETEYFPDLQSVEAALVTFKRALSASVEDARTLPFVRS